MSKIDDHRAVLASLTEWIPYLDAHSGLPGPRANLELVAACGEEADAVQAEHLLASGNEFAMICGLVALGHHVGQGDDSHLHDLHAYAADPRWRIREAVAMALQRTGDDDLKRAFAIAARWASEPDPFVRRAAVAAVCEPRLLREAAFARRALALLDRVTSDLATSPLRDRRSPAVRTLRQSLGYGWSVAVAALPADGLPTFHRLEASDDPDVAWIVRENRKKTRLRRLLSDPDRLPK